MKYFIFILLNDRNDYFIFVLFIIKIGANEKVIFKKKDQLDLEL